MGTTADKLSKILATKEDIAEAIVEKGQPVSASDTFASYANKIRAIETGGGSGDVGPVTVVPTGTQFQKTAASEGLDGFDVVTVAGDGNLVPRNIATGIEIYGVTGSLEPGTSSTIPPYYQDYVDEALELYDGSYTGLFIDEASNCIVIGFMMNNFTITEYNSSSTSFSASGWYCCFYAKASSSWSTQDYRTTASSGGNYINNMRYATNYIYYAGTAIYPVSGGSSLSGMCITLYTYAGSRVTATCGSTTYTQTADSQGKCVFSNLTSGTWTVTSSGGGSTTVQLPSTLNYNRNFVTLPPSGTTLANCTWTEINAIALAGLAETYFSVGDRKTVNLTNGQTITMVIYGFNHDNIAGAAVENTKVSITFGMLHSLNTTYNMNASNTNVGGWTDSAMRSRLQPGGAIYALLPEEVKSIIKPVLKRSSSGNQLSTIDTTTDSLFLFSEIEIFGSITYSKTGEGSQYSYFANGGTKVKNVGSSAVGWWERSPDGSNSTRFCAVGSGGNGSAFNIDASSALGVSFGFCV